MKTEPVQPPKVASPSKVARTAVEAFRYLAGEPNITRTQIAFIGVQIAQLEKLAELLEWGE